MIKNEAVTEATLETKEWEGELDDAELITVSGGILESVPVVGPTLSGLLGGLPLVGDLLGG
jgi:hypothetical protein